MPLPKRIPIAFSKNEVLLPGSEMFIPIEGSYALPLIADSLKTNQHLGIVQQKYPDESSEFFRVGTLGRIIDFQEIEEDKICVLVEGITRFTITSFEHTDRNYIRGIVLYHKTEKAQNIVNRPELKKALARYFSKLRMEPNWEIIDTYSDQHLVQYLLSCCPFESIEKQCLLEARSLIEQSQLLVKILDSAFEGCRAELSWN